MYSAPDNKTITANEIKDFRSLIDEQHNIIRDCDQFAYACKLAEMAMSFVHRSTNVGIDAAVFGYSNDTCSKRAFISYIARDVRSFKKWAYRLHEMFIFHSRVYGMSSVRLEVSQNNLHAQNFYSHLGYARIDKQNDKYLLEKRI